MERSGNLNSKNTTNKEDSKKRLKTLLTTTAMIYALTGEDAMRLAFGEDALYNNDNYEDWEDEIFND